MSRELATLMGLTLTVLGALGCGSGGPNVPVGEVDVTGTYNLTFQNLTDGVHQCHSDVQTTLVLHQSGATVTGTYTGGRISCADLPSAAVSAGGGALTHVSYDGGHLEFELGDPGWRVEGTAGFGLIQGQGTVTLDLQGTPTVFGGRAIARKP